MASHHDFEERKKAMMQRVTAQTSPTTKEKERIGHYKQLDRLKRQIGQPNWDEQVKNKIAFKESRRHNLLVSYSQAKPYTPLGEVEKNIKNTSEAQKMEYELVKGIEPGTMEKGKISEVKKGVIKDFVKEEAQKKWDNLDQPAVEVHVAITHNDRDMNVREMYPYRTDDKGKAQIGEKSKLGKYIAMYKDFPKQGQEVKCVTDANGFFRIYVA